MNTFSERLKASRKGMSTAVFAKKLGISGSALNNYERGVSVPSGKKLIHISEQLGVSVEWLLHGFETGDGRRFSNSQSSEFIESQEIQPGDVAGFNPTSANLTQAGFSTVPLLEAVLSAGGGSFETEGNVLDHFAFHSRWLRRKGRGRTDGMVLMRVTGDSMEPAIYNNDLVLIDQNRKNLRPGHVYAMTVEDMIYLKLVNASPGKLVLSSFNKEYAPVEIPTGDMEDAIRIIGRAIWWCHDA
jgi:phage repressor protein C with HTH and peptisase S24 domain